MAELKATLKQALSKNKYDQKKDMWVQRAVEDKPDENFAMSLKNADGELLAVVPKLPETAKVTSNDSNKYETERLKRASEKEDALLNKYCDGKDNAWRPDSFFEETLGEKNVPWPMRPTDFYNNPNLVSRVVMAFEESRRIQKEKQKKAEKASKKKDKKDKKSKNKKDKKEKKNKKEKSKKKDKKDRNEKKEKVKSPDVQRPKVVQLQPNGKRPKNGLDTIEVLDDAEPKSKAPVKPQAQPQQERAAKQEPPVANASEPGIVDVEDLDGSGSSSSSDSDDDGPDWGGSDE